MTGETIIKTEKLSFGYPSGQPVLNNISLEIKRGECVAIIGQNGAGKTTLAKHFNGLHKPSGGKVLVGGMDTARMKVSALARTVGYVFQNPDHQIFHDTVAREVAFGLKNTGLTGGEIKDRVFEALEAVGLSVHHETYPFNLSKGQRQRVALASVLAMKTGVIVLDEPTTGQDYRESVQIMEMVDKLNRNGHTIIFITHDMSLVARYSRRVIVLCGGELLVDGGVRTVFSMPHLLEKTYLSPPQITSLAQRLGRHMVPPDVLSVNEMHQLLLKVGSEKIGRCS